MGYTHHWIFYEPIGRVERETINSLFTDILSTVVHPPIYGPLGEGDPVIDESKVSFNGCKETGGSYETFTFTYGDYDNIPDGVTPVAAWRFCKTNRKPYDTVVCLFLIIAKCVIGDGCGLEIIPDAGESMCLPCVGGMSGRWFDTAGGSWSGAYGMLMEYIDMKNKKVAAGG